jgi:hypothetical protein
VVVCEVVCECVCDCVCDCVRAISSSALKSEVLTVDFGVSILTRSLTHSVTHFTRSLGHSVTQPVNPLGLLLTVFNYHSHSHTLHSDISMSCQL